MSDVLWEAQNRTLNIQTHTQAGPWGGSPWPSSTAQPGQGDLRRQAASTRACEPQERTKQRQPHQGGPHLVSRPQPFHPRHALSSPERRVTAPHPRVPPSSHTGSCGVLRVGSASTTAGQLGQPESSSQEPRSVQAGAPWQEWGPGWHGPRKPSATGSLHRPPGRPASSIYYQQESSWCPDLETKILTYKAE